MRRSTSSASFLRNSPAETLIKALKEDDEPAVRIAAVSVLGKLKRPELLEYLLTALQDNDPFVRLAAKEALLDMLYDPSEAVRSAAAWALQRLDVDMCRTLPATSLPGKSQLYMPEDGMHTREFIASTTRFLSALAAYLEDKRGFVHQELWSMADESILVIFCSLQNNGDCLQKTVLDTIASFTSTESMEVLLESEDEIVRRVIKHAHQFLGSRRWTELFITSLELAQNGKVYIDREIPTRIIFCGIGFWHMKAAAEPVLQQVLAILKREAICDYALNLATQKAQEASEHETQLWKVHPAAQSMEPSRQSHTSWLGKALSDIKIWYTSSRKTISHFTILNHQNIYGIFL